MQASMVTSSLSTCSDGALEYFSDEVKLRGPILRVNILMAVNAILMGVMVGIGAYGHRYRHHPLTRFLFLGATTLFLPIVSYVVSASGIGVGTSTTKLVYNLELIDWRCTQKEHITIVLAWTGLVLIIGINTTAIVAADAREGQSIPPNTVLLVQAIWTSYLALYTMVLIVFGYSDLLTRDLPYTPWYWPPWYLTRALISVLLLGPFGLIFAKLLLKCSAWYMARKSLALGRNPRLIVGYMEHLQDGSQHAELASEHIPPPLIVAGEHTVSVEKKPHGYNVKWMPNTSDISRNTNNGLVTFDKISQLNDTLLRSQAQVKDLCFAFALFKLLRCRFVRYAIAEAGFMKARSFLRHVLLDDNDVERVLRMIAHELSFLHDYYYSSLSISYPKSWLPIMNILISLLSISYCFFSTIILIFYTIRSLNAFHRGQIRCLVKCQPLAEMQVISFGSVYFDCVPLCLLAALVMLSEVRDIAYYICSNRTKVALMCHYVNHLSWRQSPTMQRCVCCVLEYKSRLNWEDKMNQCSVLVLHPNKTPVALLRRLVPLPDQQKKVPSAVKAAIVGALRSYERRRIDDTMTSLQRSLHLQAGNKILWTFDEARGTAEIMLSCHIATTILEARTHPQQPLSDNNIAANHLSRYCAYLVAYSPELLPEDDEWCTSLYKAVKEDAKRVLLGSGFGALMTSEAEYQKQLIKLLSEEHNHEVLKDGARLAGQLIGLTEEEEETAWKALAGFWSEMILYVAPSDNINGHVKALARGGELITLIWALVTHLGIVGRSDHTTVTTDGATVDV